MLCLVRYKTIIKIALIMKNCPTTGQTSKNTNSVLDAEIHIHFINNCLIQPDNHAGFINIKQYKISFIFCQKILFGGKIK